MEENNIQEKNIEEIKKALVNEQIEDFRSLYLDLHPYDQAQFFMEIEPEDRLKIYTYLSPEEVSDLMEHIDFEDIEPFFTEMDPRFAAMVLSELATDDAVDILNEMEKDKVASFLTIMEKEASDEIKELLHYEEKTAGSIMTTEFVSVYKTQTVKQTMIQLKEEGPDAETIYYMYVVDDDKRLVGVVSLRDLIISDDEIVIEDIMSEKIVHVSVADDQEDVAQTIKDYDFLAVPVVDFQKHLLGIITVDDILDVMDEEASDDYSKLAGISDVDRPDGNPFTAAKKRLPWLIILSFLGMLTASLIGQFEDTLDEVAVLAIFIPLIAGMAGNTGTQALAVAVRGLATGDYGNEGKVSLILRETGTGLITGTVCGIVIAIVISLWQQNLFLGLLVGISIMAALVVATLAGSLVPLIMDRLKIDPAVASGPFITTINDIISILIYFGIATAFMGLLA
ncbi:magnesium transporter [Ornithinibacillus sp. L9]|uniref:Magnesium transporter MgtE n=1 Tax=Ornithinibacillus caprae TaxID=2678566 RepID=A0A6N8FMK2_9BACI|nr:magnesium transporter [Ornithinibacillus caprae]MUK90563.1 magnesium transporter [Ornithinibacillus caprae]